MTEFDKPVKRRTVGRYRSTIVGAFPDPGGKKYVVELGDPEALGRGVDVIRIREAGCRTFVLVDPGTLFVKGMIAQAAAKRKAKKSQKRR
tara:strand:+ start:130 stop:399 length:270 start_codon:yes stop_codon:yes gene_type:complete